MFSHKVQLRILRHHVYLLLCAVHAVPCSYVRTYMTHANTLDGSCHFCTGVSPKCMTPATSLSRKHFFGKVKWHMHNSYEGLSELCGKVSTLGSENYSVTPEPAVEPS